MLPLHRYTLHTQLYGDRHTCVYRGNRHTDQLAIIAKVLVDEYPSVRQIARLRHEHAIETELELDGVLGPLSLEEHGHSLVLIWADPGGPTLRSLLQSGPIAPAPALRIAANLALTLASIHDRRVIHKDLNPDHIFVDTTTWQTHLTGFGIAARLSRETPLLITAGSLEGSLAYVSPEQTGRMNRSVDRRSDLYSLGMILYELLTGAPAFAATDAMDLLYSHLVRRAEAPHQRVDGVPEQVSKLVMKLIEKNAEDRYQYARAVAHDLHECVAQLEATGDVSTFPLARGDRDRGGELDIPQHLYGREAELRALLDAWGRVNTGATELLLVRGYSGIGKSVLVHEIHKELTGAQGYFVSGKFDQLGRAVPYAALALAFQDLVHLLLTESRLELDRFREQLLAAVGGNAGVLTNLIPDLERIIGPQPALPELGGNASRSRFTRAFQQLLRVVTSGGRPLVLFLDDLQWADHASLALLEALLEAGANERLLIIGAYRSNEVDASHPLTNTLREIEASARISVIELGPLGRGDVLRFVADALCTNVEDVTPLAQVIQAKTEGNPFFLIRLLVALHQDGLLYYDNEARAYRWDLAGVQATAASANVLHFMTQRIQRLSADTCRMLELAACIGHRFELETLAIIAECPPAAVAKDLWEAIEAGMLIPLDPDYRFLQSDAASLRERGDAKLGLRFCHDRVHQAAYARIAADKLSALHLRIGRLMLSSRAATNTDESSDSFELVSHLNLGRALISNPEERISLARLNLAAATKARTATAYLAAHRYFAAGLSQLDANSFETTYELAFALYLGAAEVAMLAGAHAQAEDSIDMLLQHTHTPLEQAEVLDLRVVLYASQSRSADAVRAGLEGLRLLGFTIPQSEPAQLEAYTRELDSVAAHMSGRSIEALTGRAPMQATDKRIAMKLARHTALSAFGTATNLGYWLTALAADLSLTHGNSEQSSSAYALLGAVLASSTTRYKAAHELVTLALAVHEQRGGDIHEACMLGFYFTTVSHYSMHWRSLLPYLERARVAGIESGDLLFHSYTCSHRAMARLMLGDPLDAVREDVEHMLASMHKHKLGSAAATQTVVRQVIVCLQGRSASPTALDDEACDEAQLLATIEGARMSFALYCYRMTKGMLLVLAGDHERALEQFEPLTTMIPIAFTPEARFFTALALLASESESEPPERASLLARCRQDLETWALACPANYQHRHLLVEAEAARRAGESELAMDLYDQAIAAAHEHDWHRDQAIANELAAKFYSSRGRTRTARAYMTDASYGYARWGAVAQVHRLFERSPDLVPIEAQMASRGSTPDRELDEIDMLAFARNLQLIAREVVLDDVVERVMQIVLHSAGAQRGVLMLEREDTLVVYAMATADPARVYLALGSSVEDQPELPASVVRYVARLSESVVIDDAVRDERFASDPYILRARPRSIACLAMTHQGRARGVLYLENNAVTAAFTSKRLELLGLLTAQAVISIDNADLYARIQAVTRELELANTTLEAKVAQQTTQLRVANERLTTELTERQLAQAEQARIQAQRLAELSAPVIPFTREILIMPLIGTLDQQRALEVPQAAIAGAHERRALVMIVDVTGVKGADPGIADVLVSTANALRLLGTHMIVTGVGPRMALALLEQENALAQLTTRASLEDGVRSALERVGRR